MGIEVSYRRLAAPRLAALEADPDAALDILFSPPEIDEATFKSIMSGANPAAAAQFLAGLEAKNSDPATVDIGKDWQALHFLLTGAVATEPAHRAGEPLHNLVMGGHPTAIEATYGPARQFHPEDIEAISAALGALTVAQLRERFSAAAFDAARIYPLHSGGWRNDELEGLYEAFPRLVRLFRDAQAHQEVVITYTA